jgi:hypothetical protein
VIFQQNILINKEVILNNSYKSKDSYKTVEVFGDTSFLKDIQKRNEDTLANGRKRYKITCEMNWSMEPMSIHDFYYEDVQGSELIALSTCVEVEHDEDIAFRRGQFRILGDLKGEK